MFPAVPDNAARLARRGELEDAEGSAGPAHGAQRARTGQPFRIRSTTPRG